MGSAVNYVLENHAPNFYTYMKRELPAHFVILSNTSNNSHSLHFKGQRHLIDFLCVKTAPYQTLDDSSIALRKLPTASPFLTLQYRIFLLTVLTRIIGICIFSRFTVSHNEWCTMLQEPHGMPSNTLQHLPNSCHETCRTAQTTTRHFSVRYNP